MGYLSLPIISIINHNKEHRMGLGALLTIAIAVGTALKDTLDDD